MEHGWSMHTGKIIPDSTIFILEKGMLTEALFDYWQNRIQAILQKVCKFRISNPQQALENWIPI